MANTEPNTGYRLVRLMGMPCMGDSGTLLPRPRSLWEPARVACNTFLGLARTRSGGERGRCAMRSLDSGARFSPVRCRSGASATFLTKHSLG